jgi:hypothetical protein
VTVLGDPLDVPYGPHELGQRVAEAWGFSGSRDPAHLLEAARAAVTRLDDGQTRVAYEELLRIARRRYAKGYVADNAGPPMSKLLTLKLFDR